MLINKAAVKTVALTKRHVTVRLDKTLLVTTG